MATVEHDRLAEDALCLSSNFPQYQAPGTNFPLGALYFDGTTSQSCHFRFRANDYGSGDLTLRVWWFADTATSGSVVWEACIAAITGNTDSGSVLSKAYAAASTATDTHLGTTAQRAHHVDITISNLDSVAADDFVSLKLSRLPAHASDTLSGKAAVFLATLSYSDS